MLRERSAFVVLLLALITAGCGRGATTHATTSSLGSATATRAVATQLYSVDGMSLHLACQGAGSLAVVMLAGATDDTSTWDALIELLGPSIRTCAFDYPGVGTSSPAGSPVTAGMVAATLHATLAAAGVRPPYVLVGHSLAGLSVRAYVGAYPSDVGAVVLFDPTPVEYVAAHITDFAGLHWNMATTVSQVQAVSHWPPVPTAILSSDPAQLEQAGATAADEREWQNDQRKLAALAHGSFESVAGAGHYIYRDRPDVALAAIRAALKRARP